MDWRNWGYSKKFIKEFLDLYKSLPSLYDPKDPDFTYREAKEADYSVLIEKFKEVEPSADRAFLLQKLTSLRRQYRNEWRAAKEQNREMRKSFDCLNFLPEPSPVTPHTVQPTKRASINRDPLTNEDENEEVNVTISAMENDSNESENSVELEVQLNEIIVDQFDHVAKVWTHSLQNLPRDQQIYAERIINNILFEAQVGNLTTNSPIQVSNYLHANW